MDNEIAVQIEGLVTRTVSKIMYELISNIGRDTFSDIVSKTQERVNELGVRLIEQFCHAVDEEYNSKRDRHAVVIKNRTKTRSILTSMGEVTLKRVLYLEKPTSRYFFAVDDILQLDKYARIDRGLQSDLISKATLTSYGKASELMYGAVSRQTVHNLVKRLKTNDIDTDKVNAYKQVESLYIEADEDHIHLNNGNNAEVKLIYVHEGTRTVCKGRTELVNPRYFVSVTDDVDKIWNDVAYYIYNNYRADRIHLSGDGALWIKQGLNIIPKAEYHLDKFHVYKSVTGVCYGDQDLRKHILKTIYKGDYKGVYDLYIRQYNARGKQSERNTIKQGMFYLQNNYSAIDLSKRYSCAAEGHVSHVLSARLSSRPMGWSIDGAERMAKLRAYYFNGGDFNKLVEYSKIAQKEESIHYPSMRVKANHTPYGTSTHARVVGLDGITNSLTAKLRAIVGY